MQKSYSHEIVVERPLAEAMPLFTPKGEEAWIPDWKPRYIAPPTGETRAEMLFASGAGEEETFWTCLSWQPAEGHVRYFRLTPASRAAFVDVQCRAEGRDRTRVRVGYEIEALTPSGQAYIEGLSDAAFAEMIEGWSGLIRAIGD